MVLVGRATNIDGYGRAPWCSGGRPTYRCGVVLGRFVLGVDFGTSHTTAVLRWPNGQTRALVFDGSPLLPSAVCLVPATPVPELLVGRDALHEARTSPGALEPHPKLRIDEGTVLLGDVDVPVVDLVAAVLRRVGAEARRVAGAVPIHAVLTCPAGWGQPRRDILLAAARAGFAGTDIDDLGIGAEPVAAAGYFVGMAGSEVPEAGCVIVYDLGAGTFDAAVVRRTGGGFAVLATSGLADAGGLDIDAAIFAHIGAVFGPRDPQRWRRLSQPRTDEDRRLARQLWDDIRTAKEMLSRSVLSRIRVPLFDDDVPLGREQLELLARPVLERTILTTRDALRLAELSAAGLCGLYLVGGSSRIPLVASMLHRAFGLAPTVVEQPELAVAEGSALTGVTGTGPEPADAETLMWTAGDPDAKRPPRFRRPVLVAAAVAAMIALVAASAAATLDRAAGKGRAVVAATTSLAASPAGSPSPSAPPSLVDECVIGTWTMTVMNSRTSIYGVEVNFVGSGGVWHLRADGTEELDLSGGAIHRGQANRSTYEQVQTGKITSRFVTSGGRILYSARVVTGEAVTSVNGRVRNRSPLRGSGDLTEQYACSGNRMIVTGGSYSAEWQRL
jgi:molecular chaperone DnaK